jgi:riboflavin kinase/FMN adenylyltransferase
MLIISDINTAFEAQCAGPCAVALGTFDGVHLGHRAVIRTAVEAAKAEGLVPAVFTFTGLPRNAFLPPEKRIAPLISFPEKAALIEALGVKLMLAPDFNEVANIPAEDFVREILIKRLSARHIVCGYDHRFGAHGAGDAELLMRICREEGAAVTVIPPVTKDGLRVSSTRIRTLLELGLYDRASELLGRCATEEGEGE